MMKCAPWPVLLKMEMGREAVNLLYYTWFCFIRASGLRHLMVKDKFIGSHFLTLSRGNMNGAAVKLQPDAATSFSPYELRSSLICIKYVINSPACFLVLKRGQWSLGSPEVLNLFFLTYCLAFRLLHHHPILYQPFLIILAALHLPFLHFNM